MELKGFLVILIAVVVFVYQSETHSTEKGGNRVQEGIKIVLEQQSNAHEVRGIKGPIKPYWHFPYIIMGLVSTLLLGLISVYLIRKRKNWEIIPSRLAPGIAYEALEDLGRKDLIKNGKTRDYYIELADIIRHYLQKRFDLNASTMTTEEFLVEVTTANELFSEHIKLIRDFLIHCDLVKFARYEPLGEEVDWSFRSAKEIIDRTQEDHTQ